jgi:beta-N-acetylhexosaminidase
MSSRCVVASVAVLAVLLAGCQARPQPGDGSQPGSPTGTVRLSSTSPAPASSTNSHNSSSPPTCSNLDTLRTWTVRRLAEQTIVVPVGEDAVGSVAPELTAGAGGLLLFGSYAPPDLRSEIARAATGEPGGIAPLVMTDEEGGIVQRMANLVGWLPSARDMAATMTPAEIQQMAMQLGSRMRANGVTMDLAPVLDLDARAGPNDSDAIGSRSFSWSATVATNAGLAFLTGLQRGGIVPVLKHFPGIGAANGNTDLSPAADPAWSIVRNRDLLPFQAAIRAGAPAVMISNASVPGLTNAPASISRTVISTVLRGMLGFSGLVLTDSLSAGAVQAAGYDVPRAAVAALEAGADLVLFTADPSSTATVTSQIVQAITAAVRSGALPVSRLLDAVSHVIATKHVNLCRGN